MALLGIYVGVIPVALGMLWLPLLRRVGAAADPGLLAFTVGLLGFLAVDALLEGFDIAAAGPQAFGGAALVFARRRRRLPGPGRRSTPGCGATARAARGPGRRGVAPGDC